MSRNLTKKRFESLLKKAAQPRKSVPKETETKESRLSDGCSGKCKSQDTTEGKEGLQSD